MNRLSNISQKLKNILPDAYGMKVSAMAILAIIAISPLTNMVANGMMENGISNAQTAQQIEIDAAAVQDSIGFKLADLGGKPWQLIKGELGKTIPAFAENNNGTYNQTPDGVIADAKSLLASNMEIDQAYSSMN